MSNRHLEVAIVADSLAKSWSVTALDGYSYSPVMRYKGDICAPRTLSLIGNDYLISAVAEKFLLQVWAIQSSDQVHLKMTSPGKVTALAVSPNGLFCVAGISEKIHVWNIGTGHLLAVISQHYQRVSTVKFASNDYFVTGGDDTQVLVWSLPKLLSKRIYVTGDKMSNVEPLYLWNQHSLPVTDVYVFEGLVATCSLDCTSRIYDLNSGQQLLAIILQVPLTSVCLDRKGLATFMGASNGNIYTYKLSDPPRSIEVNPDYSDLTNDIFTGHGKKVNCMAVSSDGNSLISGSDDKTCRFWHIASRQCMRVLTQDSCVTSVQFVNGFSSFFAREKKPALVIKRFERNIKEGGNDEEPETGIPSNAITLVRSGTIPALEQMQALLDSGNDRSAHNELEELKQRNKKLFHYKLNSILSRIK